MQYSFSELIEEVNEKNTSLKYGIEDIVGVTIEKGIIPTIANLSQTALDKFYIVKPGTFIYNPRTHGVRIGMGYNDTECTYITSWNNVAFKVKEEAKQIVNPMYLWMYFLRSEWDRETNYYAMGSSTIVFLWSTFQKLKIELPSIEKQNIIVRQYEVLQNRIQLKKQINDNLRASASIMFFNKIRYVQCSECCQETEIGRYPIEWTLSTLGDVLDTIIDRRGLTPTKLGSEWSNEGIIALSAKSVKNHELVNLDIANHVDNDLYNRWMPQKLQSQDILMTSEAPLGEFYYLADFSTYCLSQRLFAMRANKTIIEPTVLYFQLTDSIGKHQIDIRKTGTTVTGIRQSELIQVPIIVPPMNIQKEFARFCNPIMITIEKNADEIRQLFKLQEMLLSRLSR